MRFKRYYKLTESPDIVYTNTGTELNWSNSDGRAFGWLNIIPSVSPMLLYATQAGSTHFEIVYMVLELFQYARSRDTKSIKKVHKRDFKEFFDFYPSFDKIIDLIAQNQRAWKSIVSGQVENSFNERITQVISDEDKPVTKEMSERQLAFQHSGRIWLESKVISFWETQVDKNVVDKVFTAFGVNQDERENYLIDVIDPNNIQHEETALKELPTVKQYFSSQTAQTKRPKLSKEQQKRVADLLSKRHTETDPAKKKMIQKELEQYQGKEEDAGLQLKRIPLDIKQKIMTSESMTFRDFFKQD